jgi:hypothetical protein
VILVEVSKWQLPPKGKWGMADNVQSELSHIFIEATAYASVLSKESLLPFSSAWHKSVAVSGMSARLLFLSFSMVCRASNNCFRLD